MTPEVKLSVGPAESSNRLAVACVLAWLAAGASTRVFGIWAAIGLGGATLVFDWAASRDGLRPTARAVLLGLAAGAVMSLCTYLVYPLALRIAPFIAADTAFLYAAFRVPPAAVASLMLVPVILGEELVWRGAVQGALVRRFGPVRGVLLAATLYGLAVAPLGAPILVVVAFACGLAWGTLRQASASLVPPLLAHLLWDLLVLVWLPLDLH